MIRCKQRFSRSRRIVIPQFIALLVSLLALAASAAPYIELPVSGLRPDQLAVVYLQGDELSEKIARYYARVRQVPEANIASIALDSSDSIVSPGEFVVAKKVLDAHLPGTVQAYALAWRTPYRVGCMGMTAAFAFGFNVQFCADSCAHTRISPYYHSYSVAPFDDFGMRPAMMLAAENFEQASALIDRGVAADNTMPAGKAFLLATSDKARSVREGGFAEIEQRFGSQLDVEVLQKNAIRNERDILFYFTGSKSVKHLQTLEFMPGAMADHLTSAGGELQGSAQMSVLHWLEAGATASYGTAVEPCNFVQKFPSPLLAIWHYLTGSTAIEAYWKSVQMPGQGNFVGEPLAAPFRGYRLQRTGKYLRVYSPVLRSGNYEIFSEDFGLEQQRGTQRISAYRPYLQLEPPFSARYRIVRKR